MPSARPPPCRESGGFDTQSIICAKQPPCVSTTGRPRDNLPLLGVCADRTNHHRTIEVSVARSAGEHLTHMIEAATRVYIERTDDGADAALQVESADGTRAILRFRATALPETVDGIVEPR